MFLMESLMSSISQCDGQYKKGYISHENMLIQAFEDCTCKTRYKKIVLYDDAGGPAKFSIENRMESPLNIYVTRIDKCIKIIDNEQKCDFIICYKYNENDIMNVYYIELKGKDHKHGCAQLLSTIDLFKDIHQKYIRQCFLVSSVNVPTSFMQKNQKLFERKGCRLRTEKSISL